MRLRILVVSVILINLLSPLNIALAEEIQISCPGGGSYTLVLPGGVATNGKSCLGSLVIDSRVKMIGKEAFSFSKIDSVLLPDSVVSIEANSFSYTSFKTINLGNSLTNIGSEAFRLARFENIILPNSLKIIGECAFCDTFFTTVKLPNALISIGTNAFVRDVSRVPLKSIEIPDSVIEIGWYAFSSVGLEKLKIGKSVVEIMPGTFQNNKLKELDIPANVKFIGGFAFKNNPIEIVNFKEGLIGIDTEAFEQTKIVSLTLPDSAVKIREKAFANITNLKSVKIGNFLGIRQVDGSYAVGNIFEGSYAIENISYCGELKGFIVTPICLLSKASPTPTPTPTVTATPSSIPEPVVAKPTTVAKETTITCVKGKLTKKVTAVRPKCPTGYKKK